MKKVFNGSGVAHAWAAAVNSASNTQDGRNSGRSYWFNNRVLYSYNTPIAVLVETVSGCMAALITSYNYSSTTSRHRSDAFSAVRHMLSYSVPYLAHVASEGRYSAAINNWSSTAREERAKAAHAKNLAYLLQQCNKTVGSLIRMRGTLHYADVAAVKSMLDTNSCVPRSYAENFGLSPPTIDTAADAARIWAAHEKREARYADPLYNEKLRIANDKREAAKAAKAERDWRAAAERDKQARLIWRCGDGITRRVDSEHGGAMLRLSADGQSVETSWGIRDFPVKLARYIVRQYLAGRLESGESADRFTVRSVSADLLQIGCHDFYREEIEAFAKVLQS